MILSYLKIYSSDIHIYLHIFEDQNDDGHIMMKIKNTNHLKRIFMCKN